jgi:hypothetical protein
MTSDPLLSAHIPRPIVLGTLVLLLATSGLAQQDLRYRATGRAGAPSPVLPTVMPPLPPLPVITDASERPQPGAVPEEVWTASPYRISGTTFLVTNTNDTGAGSLRRAILDANDNPGQDIIAFLISGTGVQTIIPLSELPVITDPVIIDGATQSGYAGKPLVELNGAIAGTGVNGLTITAGNSIVRGLIINRFVANGRWDGFGIVLDVAGGNCIQGCYIGLNASGTDTLGNGGGIGIFGGSSHNLIGGTAAAERNVISGNKWSGIQISTGSAGGNRIINNYIGLDAAGDSARGNLANGIYVDAPDDTIGGESSSERNIISANNYPGVVLDTSATRTLIQGNYFGTDRLYWYGRGNNKNAIYVSGPYNTIGGLTKSAWNWISTSSQAGIFIDGPRATGNVVQGNSIGPAGGSIVQTRNNIGIWVRDAPGNTIGGTMYRAGNRVTRNALYGIEISGARATGNVIQGNWIGGDTTAVTTGAGNFSYGLVIYNAPGNTIGGTAPYAPNFIRGNLGGGIIIAGDTATGNVVQGNCIGPDNSRGKGVDDIQPDGITLAASGNLIGGTLPNESNLVAYNKRCGIFDSTGSRNAFLSNLIYSNDSLGIDLAPRGITPNDLLDADNGANGLQNFPILDSADIGTESVRIRGRMYGAPNTEYALEFFTNELPHPLHFGQGSTYLGQGSVTCGSTGEGDISVTIPASVGISQIITATATGPDLSTSEFSRELCMLDTDGDGILDLWETPGNGIDWNCDGVIDLDLYRRGASKDHKDIFVEVDYMAGRKPDPQSLANVRTVFQSVPNKYLNNPDGMNGINLVVDLEDMKSPIDNVAWADPPWPEFLAAKAAQFGTDSERKDSNWVNIREAKRLVYRYCIFANIFGTGDDGGYARASSGAPTNDFLVAVGDAITLPQVVMFESGIFMHELGHTLGLQHGGNEDKNYKPNYYSIMNNLYVYDAQDIPEGLVIPKHTWRLNFSPAPLATLNENSLDESIGLDPPPGVYDVVEIPYSHYGTLATAVLKPGTAVDWDGNMDSTGMAQGPVDLNVFPPLTGDSPGETLTSWADWPNLKYNFRLNERYLRRNQTPQPMALLRPSGTKDEGYREITMQEYLELKKLPPYGITDRMSSWSQSSLENIPIATQAFGNAYPKIISDGHRGAIICWLHGELSQSPVRDLSGVYAQRIDSLGQIHWQNNGMRITPGIASLNARITSDGAGGAIITYTVMVNPSSPYTSPSNLYAQRIDANGNLLWGAGGVGLSVNGTEFGIYAISSDGSGGAIIAWPTISGTIYAQHLNKNGTLQWNASGVPVGTFTLQYGAFSNDQSNIAHDSIGGTIICWDPSSSSATNVRAQRIDIAGSVRWGANGILLSSTGDVAYVVHLGEGHAAVAWADYRTGNYTIYAQQLDTAGTLLWGASGLAVNSSVSSRPSLMPDGRGGVIAAWYDYRNSSRVGIYGQRITGIGTLTWPSTGVCFSDSVLAGGAIGLERDHAGGTIAVFASKAAPPDYAQQIYDIYAQHVDSAGAPQWSGKGAPVCTAQNEQLYPVITGDGVGGAIAAWEDERRGRVASGGNFMCIYAQLINRSGGLGGTLVTGVAERRSAVPESFQLYQNYPNPFNPSTTIEYDLPAQSKVVIRVYDVLGRLVEELKNGIEPAGHARLRWNPQYRLASGVYFCRIEVTGVGSGVAAQNRVVKMLLLR